jgi:hypothetical protein
MSTSLIVPVYINLPITGLAFILILLFLDIKHENTTFIEGIKAIDWLGILTFLAFTMLLLVGLNMGGAIFPWSSTKGQSETVLTQIRLLTLVSHMPSRRRLSNDFRIHILRRTSFEIPTDTHGTV